MPRFVWLIVLLTASSGCHLIIDRSRHENGDGGGRIDAGPRPDTGPRDAGPDARATVDAGPPCIEDDECGPTGYARCGMFGFCGRCDVENLQYGVTTTFSPGMDDVVSGPLLLGASDSPDGTQLIRGYTVWSMGGTYRSTRFGVSRLAEVPSPSPTMETRLEEHWPSPDMPAVGAAMVTTGDRVAHLARVFPYSSGGSAVLLGTFPPVSGALGSPTPTGPFDDRGTPAPTGEIALAVDGENVRVVWHEDDGGAFSLVQSASPAALTVPVDRQTRLVSTGGPMVLAARGSSDVVYYDPFRDFWGMIDTPGRSPDDRVAGAWRERPGALPELLIAWASDTSLMLRTVECDLSGVTPSCTAGSAPTEFMIQRTVWSPVMVSLPSGSVVAAISGRSVGGTTIEEVVLVAFDDEDQPYRVPPTEDDMTGATLVLAQFGPDFIGDIAATSFMEGGRTHMVFGLLPLPSANVGAYVYRIEGCYP